MRFESLLRFARFSVPVVALMGLATCITVGCGIEASDDVGISDSNINDGHYGYYGDDDGYGSYGYGSYGYGSYGYGSHHSR